MTAAGNEPPSIRPVADEDLEGCVETFLAAEDELYGRMHLPLLPRTIVTGLRTAYQHVRSTDPERCWLADGADGTVAAFGMANQREGAWFLSFLFVRPEAQGRGLGRQVLERCLPQPGQGAESLATCVESQQPVSTGLYARHGLVPRVPIYVLIGRPEPSALPPLTDGVRGTTFEDVRAEPGGAEELARAVESIDLATVGYRRPEDHDFWERVGRLPVLYRDAAGAAIGYGYAQASGRIGPVAAATDGLVPRMLGDLLTRYPPVEGWQVSVPGTNSDTFQLLLRAGLRIDGSPAVYCSTGAGPAFERYLLASLALP